MLFSHTNKQTDFLALNGEITIHLDQNVAVTLMKDFCLPKSVKGAVVLNKWFQGSPSHHTFCGISTLN